MFNFGKIFQRNILLMMKQLNEWLDIWITASNIRNVKAPGTVQRGGQGGRNPPPVKILPPVAPNEVYDKA